MEFLIDIEKNGKKYKINTLYNDVVKLKFNKVGNNEILTIKSNENIKINKATITIPFNYGSNDLIFCNGYQSW